MITVAAFDLETTGVDVEADRIVSASLVVVDPSGNVTTAETWLLNPGIEIPAEATAVHGITTEQARADGMDAREGIGRIVARLFSTLTDDDGTSNGIPLVVYNAPFDLTMLDREYRRHWLIGLEQAVDVTDNQGVVASPIWGDVIPVIDPLVIDKHVDRYRAGRRTLEAVCTVHSVPLSDAHSSAGDATAAALLAQRMLASPALDGATDRLTEFHQAQARWARSQAESFIAWLQGRGELDRAATVSTDWPTRPLAEYSA